jgi:hypothetical protein
LISARDEVEWLASSSDSFANGEIGLVVHQTVDNLGLRGGLDAVKKAKILALPVIELLSFPTLYLPS